MPVVAWRQIRLHRHGPRGREMRRFAEGNMPRYAATPVRAAQKAGRPSLCHAPAPPAPQPPNPSAPLRPQPFCRFLMRLNLGPSQSSQSQLQVHIALPLHKDLAMSVREEREEQGRKKELALASWASVACCGRRGGGGWKGRGGGGEGRRGGRGGRFGHGCCGQSHTVESSSSSR